MVSSITPYVAFVPGVSFLAQHIPLGTLMDKSNIMESKIDCHGSAWVGPNREPVRLKKDHDLSLRSFCRWHVLGAAAQIAVAAVTAHFFAVGYIPLICKAIIALAAIQYATLSARISFHDIRMHPGGCRFMAENLWYSTHNLSY